MRNNSKPRTPECLICGHSPDMETIRNQNLDYIEAVRGYAVVGVVMVHCLLGEKGVFLSGLWGLGAKGVQLFFMASAFTLFLSHSRRRSERRPYLNFFIRRYFRIAPMFYFAIFYYLWQRHDSSGSTNSLFNILSHLTFLHGFSPYWVNTIVPGDWSIAVEFCFYATCPVLFLWVTDLRRTIGFFLVSILVGELILLALHLHHPQPRPLAWDDFRYWLLPSQLPVFIAGIAAFHARSGKFKSIAIFVAACIAGLIGQFGFQEVVEHSLAIPYKSAMLNNSVTIIASFLFFVVLASGKIPLLSNPVIRFLGKISFSVYLTHFAVLHWMRHFEILPFAASPTINFATKLLATLVLSAGISWVTFRFVEEPGRKLGSKLIARLGWN